MTLAVVAVAAVLVLFGLPVVAWLALIGVGFVVVEAHSRLGETPS